MGPLYTVWDKHGEPALPTPPPQATPTPPPLMSDMTALLDDLSYIPQINVHHVAGDIDNIQSASVVMYERKICVTSRKQSQDPEVSTPAMLFALANGPSRTPMSVNACVVDGVRYVVQSRDERRTTQNSGICAPGPDGGYVSMMADVERALGLGTGAESESNSWNRQEHVVSDMDLRSIPSHRHLMIDLTLRGVVQKNDRRQPKWTHQRSTRSIVSTPVNGVLQDLVALRIDRIRELVGEGGELTTAEINAMVRGGKASPATFLAVGTVEPLLEPSGSSDVARDREVCDDTGGGIGVG
ncbi:hypothetical protein Tco_0500683 [Tanacetum coccineum]